jgi:hypothetical protein
LLLVALPSFAAKDKPAFQTILWPESGPSALRLSFSKFNELTSEVAQSLFAAVTAQANASCPTSTSPSTALQVKVRGLHKVDWVFVFS